MSTSLRSAGMSREAFFAWAPPDGGRYEFDGVAPVALTGGTIDHARITGNVQAALRARLRDSACEVFGENAGVATLGEAVRYPNALVACGSTPGQARLVDQVVVVFEVLSPTSGRIDRIDKLREYAAVASIRRYVILESRSIGLTAFQRDAGVQAWTATPLTGADVLDMPEIGIAIPVVEFYDRVVFRT